jgi:hypothetical protein
MADVNIIRSPEPSAIPTFLSKLVGNPLLEVPQITPAHFLSLFVASIHPVTLGDYSAFDGAFSVAEVQDNVALPFVGGTDQTRPEIRLLVGLVGSQFVLKCLGWSLALLHHQERIFLVDDVAFLRPTIKHIVGITLCQLTEIAPDIGIVGHGARSLTGTRRHYIRFFSRLCVEDPLTETVHESETLWTARLYQHKDTIVFQAVPKCVNHQLTCLGRRNLLQHITEYDNIEFALVSHRNHRK